MVLPPAQGLPPSSHKPQPDPDSAEVWLMAHQLYVERLLWIMPVINWSEEAELGPLLPLESDFLRLQW